VNPATLERVTRGFAERFGGEPTAAAWAPGRVNLIGEHTDYSGGFVLPMAIERGIAAVARSAVGESRVLAVDTGETRPLDPLAFAPVGGWLGYAGGVLVLLARRSGRPGALEVAFGGDLPIGAGLSSSAALEGAVSLAAGRVMGVELSPAERAALCRRGEHEYAGVPCGIMDQAIVCSAVAGHALLIDCRDASMSPVPIPDDAAVVVMNTGVRHDLASGEYARRRRASAAAAAALGVESLRDIDEEGLAGRAGGLSEDLARCVRHVVGENARARRAARALGEGDLGLVGSLMNLSHDSLRDDFRVSCAELDTLVEAARGVPGVYGARMTGAGFGGCAIALARPEAVAALAGAVACEYRRRHGRRAEVFVSGACGPAGMVDL